MADNKRGHSGIRQVLRLDPDKTPPIRPRQQICPLLTGLKRMGCRGPHCQWWIPCEDAETGDCAMVFLALRGQAELTEGLAQALKQKRSSATEWHEEMRRVPVPISTYARESYEPEAPDTPAGAPAPREAAGKGQGVAAEPSAERLDRTHKGMSQEEVEAIWGSPHFVKYDGAEPCYVYQLPEGGRAFLIFRDGALVRKATW